VAWVLDGRDTATFRRLYDKVRHLTNCTFYTDNGEAFAKVLPSERHVIGKAHTIAVEHDNSKYPPSFGEIDQTHQSCFEKRVHGRFVSAYLAYCHNHQPLLAASGKDSISI
jgi:IS1 family transposase